MLYNFCIHLIEGYAEDHGLVHCAQGEQIILASRMNHTFCLKAAASSLSKPGEKLVGIPVLDCPTAWECTGKQATTAASPGDIHLLFPW